MQVVIINTADLAPPWLKQVEIARKTGVGALHLQYLTVASHRPVRFRK